jgi:hypothetical protein
MSTNHDVLAEAGLAGDAAASSSPHPGPSEYLNAVEEAWGANIDYAMLQ